MSAPGEILRRALIGTGRAGGPPPAAPGRLGEALARVSADPPERALLDAAALATAFARGGRTPPVRDREPLPPAPPEDRPAAPAAAVRLLPEILGGDRREQLGEWLDRATAAGVLAPPRWLPELLEAGAREAALRPAVGAVIGHRGRWLARVAGEPRLAWAAGAAPEAADDEVLETGTLAERRAWLAERRREDPGAAREALGKRIGESPAAERAALVRELGTGLSSADEPFLEGTLDDRSKVVREAAAELLARLPGSRFAARMTERARLALSLDPRGRHLVVDPPGEPDAAAGRDGLDAKPPKGRGAGAYRLETVVGFADPEALLAGLGGRWRDRIADARRTDWWDPVRDGLVAAAARHRAATLAVALLENAADALSPVDRGRLFGALDDATFEAFVLPRLGAARGVLGRLSAARTREAKLAIEAISHREGRLGEALSRAAAQDLAARIRKDGDGMREDLVQAARSLATRAVPAAARPPLAALLDGLAPPAKWRAELSAVVDTLSFRERMARAFSEET